MEPASLAHTWKAPEIGPIQAGAAAHKAEAPGSQPGIFRMRMSLGVISLGLSRGGHAVGHGCVEPTEEAPAYRRIPEDSVNACALRVSSKVICAMTLIAHALWRECDSNRESAGPIHQAIAVYTLWMS